MLRLVARSAVAAACVLAGCGARPAASTTSPMESAASPVPRLALGVTRGQLDDSDRIEDAYHRVDDYELELEASQLVRVHAPHGAFDPWLRVTGPSGFRAEDDDIEPSTLDAMLQFIAPIRGTYRVSIAAAVRGETGPYEIHVETLAALPGEALVLGLAVEGTLAQHGDPILPTSSFFHFEGDGGSIVELTVTAPAFDPVLTVLGPRGERWTRLDPTSALVVPLPTTGSYQLIVSPASSVTTGRFEISTSLRPAVVLQGADARASSPWAGPEGRGRVLGLFVGITDYMSLPGLYGAADDARFLADALSATHVMTRDDRRVLVDGQATRDSFLDGVRWLASRAQLDDVVIVFFAGHGDRQPVPAAGDPRELDGLDETIQMSDRAVTDTEVALALDAVHASSVLLAIDACHSGGFADDFMTSPGRIGLFSSDADVISDTAEARRAGGYLSWFLRRGVLGEADDGPHDGVLYAGELTDFVHAGFARDDALINPNGHTTPGQYAVIERGSVRWDSILWVYPRGEDLALPQPPDLLLESAAP